MTFFKYRNLLLNLLSYLLESQQIVFAYDLIPKI